MGKGYGQVLATQHRFIDPGGEGGGGVLGVRTPLLGDPQTS